VLERGEQPVVVALVEADRRLVQHVHDARQAGADLRGETNALRLAARQRLRRAVECQVLETDVVQEREPAHDLLDDPVGDRRFLAVEPNAAKELHRPLERQAGDLVDRTGRVALADLDEARLAPQARAVALRAGLVVEVLRELFAHHHRIGLAVASLEVGQDALEGVLAGQRLAAVGEVRERNFLIPRAIQDQVLHPLRQLRERAVDVEADEFGEARQELEIELVAPVPAADRARGERELRKCHHALGIEEADRAQAVAARAGADRAVEREQARLELLQRVVADRARELGGKEVLPFTIHLDRDGAAVAVAQRRLERFGKPLLELLADLEPVDHHLDGVLGRLGKLGNGVDLVHLAVDANAREAFGAELDEELEVLALAVDDHRREDHEPQAVGVRAAFLASERERRVDHLRDRHRRELLLGMVGAVRVADASEQEAQVVVDLGDRANGRARVVRGCLLLDGDGRGQAFDEVDVRLFHELQELACVRRQRFDVTALAFRVQRIEGERALARPRQSGDDDEPMPRQIEIQVLEIMRACAADADRIHAGFASCFAVASLRKCLRAA
jgi:hypothetical protein